MLPKLRYSRPRLLDTTDSTSANGGKVRGFRTQHQRLFDISDISQVVRGSWSSFGLLVNKIDVHMKLCKVSRSIGVHLAIRMSEFAISGCLMTWKDSGLCERRYRDTKSSLDTLQKYMSLPCRSKLKTS